MDQQPHERRSDTQIPKPQICFESRFDVIKIIMSFALHWLLLGAAALLLAML